jgi:hypothetical protein
VVSQTISLGCVWTENFLISASWIARITGMRQKHLFDSILFLRNHVLLSFRESPIPCHITKFLSPIKWHTQWFVILFLNDTSFFVIKQFYRENERLCSIPSAHSFVHSCQHHWFLRVSCSLSGTVKEVLLPCLHPVFT